MAANASITGKFLLDFTAFKSAVNDAEVTLKTFDAGAGNVTKSLNRMSDSLTGQSLIRNATLMAEAVEKLGGTALLTESELQKLGGQAGEAIAKMRAMGVTDIPKNLYDIAEASKAATKGTESLTVSVG